ASIKCIKDCVAEDQEQYYPDSDGDCAELSFLWRRSRCNFRLGRSIGENWRRTRYGRQLMVCRFLLSGQDCRRWRSAALNRAGGFFLIRVVRGGQQSPVLQTESERVVGVSAATFRAGF